MLPEYPDAWSDEEIEEHRMNSEESKPVQLDIGTWKHYRCPKGHEWWYDMAWGRTIPKGEGSVSFFDSDELYCLHCLRDMIRPVSGGVIVDDSPPPSGIR